MINKQEKMLNIISHEGNDNQNHKEISFHIHQYGYNKKAGNNKCWLKWKFLKWLSIELSYGPAILLL